MSNFSYRQPGLRFWLLSFCLLFIQLPPTSAAVPTAGRPSKDESASITAEAIQVDRAPKLDGTLDDPLWRTAKPITEFRQREPAEGDAPTEKKKVLIMFHGHSVYF